MKISALPTLTDPAADDVLPIVDDSTGLTKQLAISTLFSYIYPVGTIYTNAEVDTNPATLFGFGTWTAHGVGRVLVGVDTGQTEFNTLGETGGAKTHTLTIAEMPSHSHTMIAGGSGDTRQSGGNNAFLGATNTGLTGGGGAHNNLQPYVTVYIWKRTA